MNHHLVFIVFVRERVELLIKLPGSDLRTNLGIIVPPASTLFQCEVGT